MLTVCTFSLRNGKISDIDVPIARHACLLSFQKKKNISEIILFLFIK